MSNTIFQIQARGRFGDWDSEYVDSDAYATDFATMEEAEQELKNLVEIQGLDPETLRILEIG